MKNVFRAQDLFQSFATDMDKGSFHVKGKQEYFQLPTSTPEAGIGE